MERRTFLKTLGVGSTAFVNFLFPSAIGAGSIDNQDVESQSVDKNGAILDPNFAGGWVIQKTKNGVILDRGDDLRAVRIPDTAILWKEFDGSPSEIEIEVGDYLDARGVALKDGSLRAQQGWINIGKVEGVIEQVTSQNLDLTNVHGHLRSMEFSSKLEVIHAKDGAPVEGHLSRLAKGSTIGAVGLRLPNGGFRATRIWLVEEE
ncbi:MAG: hypothetical protein EYC68_16135 [Chloroflexota bacterium]|nr:MAG: hypothetical protein EYC68_16135 [Chloroflexota bacterium]